MDPTQDSLVTHSLRMSLGAADQLSSVYPQINGSSAQPVCAGWSSEIKETSAGRALSDWSLEGSTRGLVYPNRNRRPSTSLHIRTTVTIPPGDSPEMPSKGVLRLPPWVQIWLQRFPSHLNADPQSEQCSTEPRFQSPEPSSPLAGLAPDQGSEQ